jgi:hypothetical protein
MPADDIETRIIHLNERVLTASVSGTEHIESRPVDGVGVIRIYFHPGANVAEAETQVTATCQTFLKVMAARRTSKIMRRGASSRSPGRWWTGSRRRPEN